MLTLFFSSFLIQFCFLLPTLLLPLSILLIRFILVWSDFTKPSIALSIAFSPLLLLSFSILGFFFLGGDAPSIKYKRWSVSLLGSLVVLAETRVLYTADRKSVTVSLASKYNNNMIVHHIPSLPSVSSSGSPLTSGSCVWSSVEGAVDDPASSRTGRIDAGLCPRIASSFSKNLHVCLPLPVTP